MLNPKKSINTPNRFTLHNIAPAFGGIYRHSTEEEINKGFYRTKPEKEENPINLKKLPVEMVKKLKYIWPDLCFNNDEQYINSQWLKHGIQTELDPEDYLRLAIHLYDQCNVYDLLQQNGISPGKLYYPSVVRDCLKKELGVTPFLEFLFHKGKQFINEIRIGFSIKIAAKEGGQMFNLVPKNLIQTDFVGVAVSEHKPFPKDGGVGLPKRVGATSPLFLKALKDASKNTPPKISVRVEVRTEKTKVDFSAQFLFERMSNMKSHL